MFFYASKIIGFLAIPSNVISVVAAIGIVLLIVGRARRIGVACAALGLAGLLIGGYAPLANLLIWPLERAFPHNIERGEPVDGIIILGGGLAPDATMLFDSPEVNEAGERVIVALRLARDHPQARILLSGGSGMLIPERYSEADATARTLVSLGVDPARIIVENRSRNTHENAVFSREAADPQAGERWLLVTSAWHMPRSVGLFRQAGFPVVPHPVDYRVPDEAALWRPFRTMSDGLRRLDVAVREWVGLVVYRATGRTDALFPRP